VSASGSVADLSGPGIMSGLAAVGAGSAIAGNRGCQCRLNTERRPHESAWRFRWRGGRGRKRPRTDRHGRLHQHRGEVADWEQREEPAVIAARKRRRGTGTGRRRPIQLAFKVAENTWPNPARTPGQCRRTREESWSRRRRSRRIWSRDDPGTGKTRANGGTEVPRMRTPEEQAGRLPRPVGRPIHPGENSSTDLSGWDRP
jgi:hypothetical protein